MSVAWARGSTKAWRRVRALVLARDNYRCQIKGKFCTTVANTVDHVVPKSEGGSDDPSNLRAACAWCNNSRGAMLGDPEPLARW